MSSAPKPRPFAAEGQRLRSLVDSWPEGRGVRAFAARTGVTPEALYSWFRGENLPSLTSVRALAGVLEMRPVDVVAVLDGVTAPTQQEAPSAGADGAMWRTFIERWAGTDPPPWAKALTQSILSAIDRDRKAFLDQAAAQYSEIAVLLNELGNGDAAPPGSTGPQPKRPGPRRGPSA